MVKKVEKNKDIKKKDEKKKDEKKKEPKIISVANMKGGVGKTCISINIAATLAKNGAKVLLIDCDFQANTSQYLNVLAEGVKSKRNLYEGIVTGQRKLQDSIIETDFENLDVIPARFELYDFNLRNTMDTELRQWLRRKKLLEYDFVIMDTRPEISKLFTNVMMVTDFVLIPLTFGADAIMGLSIILKHLYKIQSSKSDLRLLGVVFSNIDKQNNTSIKKYKPFLESFLKKHGIPVLGNIPRSKAVATAEDEMQPLVYRSIGKKLPIHTAFENLTNAVKKEANFSKGRVQRIPQISVYESEEAFLTLSDDVDLNDEDLLDLDLQ